MFPAVRGQPGRRQSRQNGVPRAAKTGAQKSCEWPPCRFIHLDTAFRTAPALARTLSSRQGSAAIVHWAQAHRRVVCTIQTAWACSHERHAGAASGAVPAAGRFGCGRASKRRGHQRCVRFGKLGGMHRDLEGQHGRMWPRCRAAPAAAVAPHDARPACHPVPGSSCGHGCRRQLALLTPPARHRLLQSMCTTSPAARRSSCCRARPS